MAAALLSRLPRRCAMSFMSSNFEPFSAWGKSVITSHCYISNNKMAANYHIESKLDEIFNLYEKWGHQIYIGEACTQLQHAQQASNFAAAAGYNEEVIFGAFVHDIGHLLGLEKNLPNMELNGIILGTVDHDLVGEEFLKDLGFCGNVTQFVRGHVQAKRYRVYKDPGYHARLSEASKGTLVCQGGPMDEKEAAAFEKQETFRAILEMRKWDEDSKDSNIPVTDNKKYRQIANNLLSKKK